MCTHYNLLEAEIGRCNQRNHGVRNTVAQYTSLKCDRFLQKSNYSDARLVFYFFIARFVLAS